MNIGRRAPDSPVAGIVWHEDSNIPPIVSFVSAAGEGREALRFARRYGIPVKRDPQLADYLSVKVEGSPVDRFIYRRVARLLLELHRDQK